MFRRDTIQSVSLVLIGAMALWGTGITRAAIDATYGSPLPSAPAKSVQVESDNWTPLTDSELAKIKGGWVLIARLAVAIAQLIVTTCTLVVTVYRKNHPTVPNPYQKVIIKGDNCIWVQDNRDIYIQKGDSGTACNTNNPVTHYDDVKDSDADPSDCD